VIEAHDLLDDAEYIDDSYIIYRSSSTPDTCHFGNCVNCQK